MIVLQDLIYGLFLRDKGFKSITGDILSGNDAQHQEETQTSPLAKFSMNRRAKEHERLMKSFNDKQPQMYSAPSGFFEKTENKIMNISLGDINVHGAKNPKETALLVREELVALFTGEKIKNGVLPA